MSKPILELSIDQIENGIAILTHSSLIKPLEIPVIYLEEGIKEGDRVQLNFTMSVIEQTDQIKQKVKNLLQNIASSEEDDFNL
jgi:hypothetical protein